MDASKSAIARLVAHHGGPTAFAAKLDGFAYQEIQRWAKRGWAPPKHFMVLEPFLPRGIKLRDLHEDVTVYEATVDKGSRAKLARAGA